MKRDASVLKIICSMLIFGTIGLFRRWLPFSSAFIAMARGILGALLLTVVIFRERGKISWNILRRHLPALLLSGAAIGANWIFLFESYRYTTVAAATLCYYLAPTFVVLASPLVTKEKLTPCRLICAAVALCGMIPVSGILSAGSKSVSVPGILYGVAAALLYAGIVLCNKKLEEVPALERTWVQLACAGVALVPYVLLTGAAGNVLPGSGVREAVILLLLGFLHTGVAYLLYFGAIGELPAQTAAMLSYLDPVSAILLSALFLGEPLGWEGALGAVLILGAAVVSEIFGAGRKGIS